MPAVTPPPALPNMPEVSERFGNYLRRFSLWCVGNFNNSIQKATAMGELYLTSTTGTTVWRVTIDDSGALHTTQMNPGSGTGP